MHIKGCSRAYVTPRQCRNIPPQTNCAPDIKLPTNCAPNLKTATGLLTASINRPIPRQTFTSVSVHIIPHYNQSLESWNLKKILVKKVTSHTS